MSTGLKAPSARGLARPAPVKKSGLARPTTGLTKTPSANKVSGKLAGSRESITSGPIRSASRSALKSSASSQSINSGLSRSGSSASVNDMNPLKVGTRVKTKDTKLEGTVRFCGEPQFASGIWVGVELDTENGKNDGEVKGVRYFQCEPQHGLFCKPDKLNRKYRQIKEPAMRPIRTPSNVNVSKVNYEAKFGLRIGGRCIVNETKEGTLLFVGLTQFAKGVWAGVALDTDDGKNDGSVKGERYFTCDPGFGLFSQAAKIKMIDSPLSSTTSLSSFDTPRKASVNNNGEEVMKPDFINRTPASTPGIKSSLSGLLSKSRDENNKNRDIESMQKNIGDLQQRLSEVTSPTTKNGPAIPSLLRRESSNEATEDQRCPSSSSSDLDQTLTDDLTRSDDSQGSRVLLNMDTPDLFEDPLSLSEYCRSPSPAPSTTSSVRSYRRKLSQNTPSMIPDFNNRREDQTISEVISSKFKKKTPKIKVTKSKASPDTRFIRQNIQKWNIDIRTRRDSEGSSPSSNNPCPQHSPSPQTRTRNIPVRVRSYSSSRQEPEDPVFRDTKTGSLNRGLSVGDLQKLDQISHLFDAFKCPIDVAAGRRSDVLKRIKDKSLESVPLCRLMDGVDQEETPSTRLNSTSSNHSPDQYEQLKQLHEESEKARNDLAEKVKASENEKLTFEARLAEVAEAADKEKSGLNFKLEQQNKEIVVLKSNNSSQISKLQDEINNLETELAISLDKIGDYESSALQNDNSGEIAMNQEQIAELQAELKKINHAIDQDQSKIAHLESELSDALLLSETLQSDINQMTASQDGAAGQFSTAQSRIKELEAQLADATSSLSDYKSNSDSCTADFVAEREINKELSEELESFKQQSSDLDNEIFSMRSAHESYVQSSDNKLSKLEDQLQEEGQTLAKLRSELSELSSSSSSDKIHLEQKLQDSLNSISRLQEQAARDAARISDLDNMLSSAESDGSSELIVAHKKISELENVLKERKTASDVELREVNDTVTELRVELSREKQLASEQLEIGNKKCKDLQVSYDQIQMERSMEQIQTEKEIGELQLQLAETDKLRSDNSRLNNNINTLQTQLSTLQTKCDNLQDSNKGISRLQDQMESERTEHANLVASLENNIDELETRLAIANNDKAAQSEMSAKNEAVMQAQITSLERETERLREQLVEQEVKAEERITKLEAQLGEIATISTEKTAEIAELREELDGCKDQLNDSELQLRDLAEEYDSKRVELEGSQATVTELESHMKHLTDEKRVLSSELLTITKELGELKIKTNRQSDEEIENLHKQINNLTEENDMLKLDFQEKNAEFDDLTMEVTNLREISETAFTEIKKNELQFTTSVKKLKTTEIQLDEALGRMRDLQCKINDLEEEVVRERSRTHELEQRLNSPPVMSFENIDNLSNISSSPPITAPGFIPNRVFCDNCDVFDEHDTENCPVGGVSPGGIRHGGLRGLSGRPYCTVCEMFGHTAAECEDDMTF
ncbi:CAP-Gly domain-containing linker protein 1-like isoform X6 [Bolinopsis microptera]|uniref:CAP-Gly domain-containing linker protein 1-like isoform X6 n=1 Tax=Bolinopsis microptera TaxID=2820187 RepID=UPI003079088C